MKVMSGSVTNVINQCIKLLQTEFKTQTPAELKAFSEIKMSF